MSGDRTLARLRPQLRSGVGECDERGWYLLDVPIGPLAEYLGVQANG